MIGERATREPDAGGEAVEVLDGEVRLSFTVADLMRYHGPGSPGGVAHAFKAMQRAFPLLDDPGPPERRALFVATASGGPGVRDAFELVTRAVTEGRYAVDSALARPERGMALERFVFRLEYRERIVTLQVRAGLVPEELIALVRRERRSAGEERRAAELKREMAKRVLARPASEVYDVV